MRKNKNNESFETRFQRYWRPAMGWMYALVCLFDFMLAPILLAIYTIKTKQSYIAWQPLTIQGGGLFHVAMGTVVGITSWSRGQEKMTIVKTDAQNPGLTSPPPPAEPVTEVQLGPVVNP